MKGMTRMIMTLRDWQKICKQNKILIVQGSARDGSDSWQPFPIGMSWQYTFVYNKCRELQIGTHKDLLLVAIKPQTDQVRRPGGPNRKVFIRNLEKNGFSNTFLEPAKYFESLPTYKFIASPEGNGIDCHRHYEALIAGCIPIIEHNSLIEEKYKGCPILYTKDYSEITAEYLERIYKKMLDETYDFSCLSMTNYDDATQAVIKECGNFWTVRMNPLNGPWYRN